MKPYKYDTERRKIKMFMNKMNLPILILFFTNMSVADIHPQRIINKSVDVGEIENVLRLHGGNLIHSKHHLTLYTNVLDANKGDFTLLPGSKETYFSLSNKGSLLGHSYNVKFGSADLRISVLNHTPSISKYDTKDFDGFKICYLYSVTIVSNVDTSVDLDKLVTSIALPATQMKFTKDQPQVIAITQEKVFK